MEIELITQLVLVGSSLVGTLLMIAFLVSRRFRLRFVRGLLADYAMLLTYSQMGEKSGDVRFKTKIENILTNSMGGLVSRVISDNPVVQVAVDYLINETEIGDYLTDPRTLPIIMSFVQKNMQGVDLSGLLGGISSQKQMSGDNPYG